MRLAVVVEVTGFFSSSLALTLARLRCVAVVEDDVGRRVAAAPAVAVVDDGGRVGGLLRPVVAVLAAGAVELAAVGRREAEVAVAPVALDEAAVPGARGDAVLGAAALLDMVGVWLARYYTGARPFKAQ